tara:strand:+ start:138 stop:650 length:513 start_codon:yes stop_codon:yes gene_type:complete
MTTTNQNPHTTFYVWDDLTEALETFNKALVQRDRGQRDKTFFLLEEDQTKLAPGLRDAYQTLIRKCHNDELPNDWRYEKIKYLVERLIEYKKESLEDYQDILHEVVDSCVDISTSAQFQWLADIPSRAEFMDESFMGESEELSQLAAARQYEELDFMANTLLADLSEGIS